MSAHFNLEKERTVKRVAIRLFSSKDFHSAVSNSLPCRPEHRPRDTRLSLTPCLSPSLLPALVCGTGWGGKGGLWQTSRETVAKCDDTVQIPRWCFKISYLTFEEIWCVPLQANRPAKNVVWWSTFETLDLFPEDECLARISCNAVQCTAVHQLHADRQSLLNLILWSPSAVFYLRELTTSFTRPHSCLQTTPNANSIKRIHFTRPRHSTAGWRPPPDTCGGSMGLIDHILHYASQQGLV